MRILNFLKKNLFLVLILFFALVLRVLVLDFNPPSLNWDEISHGYNAYSILKTGKDEWGASLPLIFRAYGDYKLPLYIYLTALSEFFFGLTEFAVRLPSALGGTATVLFTYLLTKELLGSRLQGKPRNPRVEIVALISALLVAIEPWSLFLSRGAFEANLGLAFFTSGLYFAVKGLHTPKSFVFASLLFGLTVWSYNSYRIFLPLFLLVFILIYRRKLLSILAESPKQIFLSLSVLALFLIPMLWQLFMPVGQARYGKVAIIDEGAINKINEDRRLSNNNPLYERLSYNKVNFFLRTAARNWTLYFSPQFLFIEGGSQFQYNVPKHGLLYLINLPFIIIGLIVVIAFALQKRKWAYLFLFWLVLAPIPAAVTRDSPHTLRGVTMLPLLMIVTSLGVVYFSKFVNKVLGVFSSKKNISKAVGVVVLILYLGASTLSLERYLTRYFTDYRESYSWSWQYGYKEVVNFLKERYSGYDKIIVTKKYGEPHIFFLFYGAAVNAPWPTYSENYRTDANLLRYEKSDWYWVDRFGKFYFVNDWDIPTRSDLDFKLESGEVFDCDSSSCILITSPGNYHKDWKLLETVYFLDGQPAFEILEN